MISGRDFSDEMSIKAYGNPKNATMASAPSAMPIGLGRLWMPLNFFLDAVGTLAGIVRAVAAGVVIRRPPSWAARRPGRSR